MGKIHKNPDQRPMDFMLPPTEWVHPDVLPDMRNRGMVAIDTETKDDGLANNRGSGWVYDSGHIAGVSMSCGDLSVYAAMTHPDSKTHDPDAVRRWVKDHNDAPIKKVYHNAPYDLGWMLTEWGLKPPENLHDTQIMAYLLDEERFSYSLDNLCAAYGVAGKDEQLLRDAANALGCDPKSDMWRMPARFVGGYAEQDAKSTYDLASLLLSQLEGQGLGPAYQLECDLIPMIIEMRRKGVRIDTNAAPQVRSRLLQRRNMYLSQMSEKLQVGRPIEIEDINSPRFLLGIFKQENIPYSTTEKGNPSFKTDEIEKLDHWLPELIVGARKAHDAGEKFIGNYIQNYTHLGRIHSEAKSTKTKTTRFAYSDPPLQQMPGRNPEISGLIRGLFLPEKGHVWGALDYSQQEFRLMVHYSYLCKMAGVDEAVQMYRDNPKTDFHDLAAKLTKLPRRKAKDVNFAKAFGAGVPKFALMTGMTLEEAQSTMEEYDRLLPFISRLGDYCKNRADNHGYIKLLDKARRHFDRFEPRWTDYGVVQEFRNRGLDPKLNPVLIDEARARVADEDHPWSGRLRRAGTHKAMNSLIQGSAARQTKLVMRELWREGIVPMLQMHDELDFSFSDAEDARRAHEIMVETVTLEVPVVVDAEFGTNWGNAKVKKSDSGVVEFDATFESAMRLVKEAA